MAENERPLSDFISSVEQVDLPDEDVIQEEVNKPTEKKSKIFPIIVGILLVLIIGVGGYIIYKQYFNQEEVLEPNTTGNQEEQDTVIPETDEPDNTVQSDEEPKSEGTIDEVTMTLFGQNLTLSTKLPTSSCDDTGFVSQVQENSNFLIYEDNQNGRCSDGHIVQFFVDEEYMSQIISDDKAKYPLEKIVVDGIEYEYIDKEDYTEENGAALGTVYMKSPKLNIAGYEAFRVLSFYKVFPLNTPEEDVTDAEVLKDGTITTYCVFDLSEINSKAKGYLMFSGFASVGSEINYCEMLDSTEEFEIKIY